MSLMTGLATRRLPPRLPLDRDKFGVRLRELRDAANGGKGYSQIAVAIRSNGAFTQPHYSQWESGKYLPSILQLPALAMALECSLADLYTDPKIKRGPAKGGHPRKPIDESDSPQPE